MKKDNLRDYAVQAFICYSQLGCPTRGELEGRIRIEVHRRMEGYDPKLIVLAADKEIRERWEPYLADVEAVGGMLQELENGDRNDIADAVRAVYFLGPSAVLPDQVDVHIPRNEISDRIVRCSMKVYASERTVCRWLRYARDLFAVKRGLAQWGDK